MVGCEEKQVVATPHFIVQYPQKMRQLAVELHVCVVVFLPSRSVCVSDGIGRRHADCKKVGCSILAKMFVEKRSLGHLEGFNYTNGRCLHISSGLYAQLFVRLFNPIWQFVHIIG